MMRPGGYSIARGGSQPSTSKEFLPNNNFR
jgi:hypothetical protein